MAQATPQLAAPARSAWALSLWAVAAAFGTYFCTYAFRKPWTAATFADGTVWGVAEKSVLVVAQVLGYTTAKFVGIGVVAATPPRRRAARIVALNVGAELALVLFGIAPSPLRIAGLFLNGLALGMVYGLVLGFLEGRRQSDALTAGLCASFILADGVCKATGTWLLDLGVPERWMPAAAGGLFLPPTLLFVWMLTRIPPPTDADVAHRAARLPMDRRDRAGMLREHALVIGAIIVAYLMISIGRGLRADFAPELWKALGVTAAPATFARSELLVAFGALAANGLLVLVTDNRTAFFGSIGVGLAGCALMMVALAGLPRGLVGPFPFVVLLGLGLYLPYVAVQTTLFERLIALTRRRCNLAFLLYVADTVCYLGYASMVLVKGWLPTRGAALPFFMATWWAVGLVTLASLSAAAFYVAARTERPVATELVA